MKAQITRRHFGMAALIAAATVGCSKDDGEISYAPENISVPLPPEVESVTIPGGGPHNCTGRCILRATVQNNTIKRIITDERPDSHEMAQLRACPKCRAYKGRVHSPDRLMYPLIYDQGGSSKRGDLSKFRRTTWEEAINYIHSKYMDIKSRYPNANGIQTTGSGVLTQYQTKAPIDYVINRAMGGCIKGWGTPSFHAGTYIHAVTQGTANNSCNPVGAYGGLFYSPDTHMYSDVIILWGANFVQATGSSGSNWWITRARENGARLIYIGPLYNNSAEHADEFIPIKPGTDAALILALIHELIVNDTLDYEAIERLTVGFFDDPSGAKPIKSSIAGASTVVPAGRSLASYIMGTGYSNGTVTIAASTWGDEFPGAASSKYAYKRDMNVRKSPEWAAPLCGVSADKIRELAAIIGDRTKRCAIRSSMGVQRQPNGYINVWLQNALMLVSGQFGILGTGLNYLSNVYTPNGLAGTVDQSAAWPTYPNAAQSTVSHIPPNLRPPGNHSANPTNVGKPSNPASFSFPDAIVFDAIRKANRGISRWGDGEVAKINKPVKFFYNIHSGSMVNQHQDCFGSIDLLENRNEIELIVTVDNFMTPSARYSDVVLPADMNWEREEIVFDQNNMLYLGKAVDPKQYGEIMSHEEIALMLGKKFAIPENDINGGLSVSQRIEKTFNNAARPVSFEQFKKDGVLTNGSMASFVQSSDIRAAGTNLPVDRITTHTGYYELYSTNVVAHYTNRGNTNLDSENEPEVLSIPFWISYEDHHRDLYDMLNVNPVDYPYYVLGQHSNWRTHSIHDNNLLLREYYKRDEEGDFTHDSKGYEPILMSPNDVKTLGFTDGMLVKVTSGHTKRAVLAVVQETVRCVDGIFVLEQGGWFDPVEHKGEIVDKGGCSSTLISEYPGRWDRGPGMQLCQVKVEKA